MFDNFDNDTFEKARKLSLRFCAAISIILYLQVDLSNLDVFGIKLETDKKHLIFVSIAMWIYTTIIFWWFAYKKNTIHNIHENKYNFIENHIKPQVPRSRNMPGGISYGSLPADRHASKLEKDAHEHEYLEKEYQTIKEKNELFLLRRQFIIVDILPTLLMQLVSAYFLNNSLQF